MPTQETEQAIGLFELWVRDRARLIGPPLFNAELTSVLRLQVYLKRLLAAEGEEAFRQASQLNVETVNPPELYKQAWELAKKHNLPRTYDMQYLALAEIENCELWTADKRLVNALKGPEPRVHWVGDA